MPLERLDPSRYTSPDFANREWEKMWTCVWNMGPRVEELADSGDIFVHTLGPESIIFARQQSGDVRAYYNVCAHRGNQICQAEGPGHVSNFRCAFHGWTFGLDGAVKNIPSRERFPQLSDDAVLDELKLKQIRVEEWAGWLWFNFDSDCEPLDAFLADMKTQLDGYKMERSHIVDYKTFRFPANWKTTHDAFHESYHFRELHPEILDWGNDDAPITLMGLHSMMVNEYGAPSAHAKDPTTINETLQGFMEQNGIDPATFKGTPADVRIQAQKNKRAQENETHYAYSTLSDGQLTDAYHYLVFPNIHFNLFPEFYVAMRHRPSPDLDPNFMYFDFIMCLPMGPGMKAPPLYEHKVIDAGAVPVDQALEWGEWAHPVVNQVLAQDVSLIPSVQRGMRSRAFEGPLLGEDEVRITHFNENLDRYLNH
jgi:phenylpropionate dioxygenase-like ring-hydroxylating dioxygenase large terminal subunit